VEMQGGTTFHFVTDGIESALEQARAAAGEKGVSLAAGRPSRSNTSQRVCSTRSSSRSSRTCSEAARGCSRTWETRSSSRSSRSPARGSLTSVRPRIAPEHRDPARRGNGSRMAALLRTLAEAAETSRVRPAPRSSSSARRYAEQGARSSPPRDVMRLLLVALDHSRVTGVGRVLRRRDPASPTPASAVGDPSTGRATNPELSMRRRSSRRRCRRLSRPARARLPSTSETRSFPRLSADRPRVSMLRKSSHPSSVGASMTTSPRSTARRVSDPFQPQGNTSKTSKPGRSTRTWNTTSPLSLDDDPPAHRESAECRRRTKPAPPRVPRRTPSRMPRLTFSTCGYGGRGSLRPPLTGCGDSVERRRDLSAGHRRGEVVIPWRTSRWTSAPWRSNPEFAPHARELLLERPGVVTPMDRTGPSSRTALDDRTGPSNGGALGRRGRGARPDGGSRSFRSRRALAACLGVAMSAAGSFKTCTPRSGERP
jgi:hypothetical protein